MLKYLIGLMLLISMGVQAEEFEVYGAFQTYEKGYMVWESDGGGIWVLYNDGTGLYYPLSSYEALSSDTVYTIPKPGDRVRPVGGFGKLWGNLANVRLGLGWATTEEQGYTIHLTDFVAFTQTRLTIPTGQEISINGSQWSFVTEDVPIPPQPADVAELPAQTVLDITVQQFEHGFMMWWRQTGSIWIFTDAGQAFLFNSTTYGRLSDNPVRENAPSGLLKPIFGFGKVWGHFPWVRETLGWATNVEVGYRSIFERHIRAAYLPQVTLIVILPDGRQLTIYDSFTWSAR